MEKRTQREKCVEYTQSPKVRTENKTVENIIYILGWGALALLAGYYLLAAMTGFSLEKIGIPCTFHLLTGYYCPGCGGTRAVKALLEGRLWESFCYHPVVLVVALGGTWFMISQTVERISRGKLRIGMRYRDGYLWLILGIIIINCIVKNVLLFLTSTNS